MVIVSLAALPFVNTTIAVTSQGIVRPVNERTEVRSIIGGIIDTIYYHEGNEVKKGTILLRLKDQITHDKLISDSFEISLHHEYIHDLQLLTTGNLNENLLPQLKSQLYKEQLNHFLYEKTDQDATLKKASKELDMYTTLLKGKAVTQKDFFDTQVQYDKANSSYKAFMAEQQSNWQEDLTRYGLELSQYNEEQNQLNTDASYYKIKAPVSGTLQGINTRYTGSVLQPNETLCTVSPNGNLIGECYVTTKDIGLIKPGQIVHFKIDAFDYNYFGMITGKVSSLDNDFTTFNNTTVFIVRCRFDATQLHLKNGFTSNLHKGLTFQARFITGDRTLWQLLWDNINDWTNPNAPQQTS